MAPTREAFLPPDLPRHLDQGALASSELWRSYPVTRYWGMERRQEVDGLPPSGIPGWLAQYDWVVGWSHGWADLDSPPKSIYCHPGARGRLESILQTTAVARDAILVVGGEDTRLSTRPISERLLSLFEGGVFYEAYDRFVDGVEVMPIGLQEFYLRGYEEAVLRLQRQTVAERIPRIVAAWGAWWPKLDLRLEDRKRARDFAQLSALVDEGLYDTLGYFERLSRHEFMLAPMGNGIQSPKMFEAWMMGCIPISTPNPAVIRLKERGFPIAVIDRWEDIDESVLSEWSRQIGPTIREFRAHRVLNAEYWDASFVSKTALISQIQKN